jgi:protein-S-isoprenylcysteine O-methyltransferase Ste14
LDTNKSSDAIALGKKFFQMRDYTPIPLLLLILIFAQSTPLSATIGVLFILVGELIRIYAVSFIGTISRTRNDHTGNKLVQEGPFAMVRNPLYVGNFFIASGVAAYSGSVFMFILTVVLFCVQYYFIVKYEESLLEASYGAEYDAFRSRVPAWIPNFRAFSMDQRFAVTQESFRMAIKSETKTLMTIVAVLALLIWRSKGPAA